MDGLCSALSLPWNECSQAHRAPHCNDGSQRHISVFSCRRRRTDGAPNKESPGLGRLLWGFGVHRALDSGTSHPLRASLAHCARRAAHTASLRYATLHSTVLKRSDAATSSACPGALCALRARQAGGTLIASAHTFVLRGSRPEMSWCTLRTRWHSRPPLGMKGQSCPVLR